MELDTVLLLVATLIGHSMVAYTTVWYIFKKKSSELAEYAKPEKLVPLLIGVMNYREPVKPGEPDDTPHPTMLEALCGYLGASLGRYISGMMGRTARDVNSAALQAIGEKVPIVKAMLGIPGMAKIMKNPMVQQFIGPAIEKALGGQGGPPEGGAG